jgi:hypothetical protein
MVASATNTTSALDNRNSREERRSSGWRSRSRRYARNNHRSCHHMRPSPASNTTHRTCVAVISRDAILAVAASLLFVLFPDVVTGQTSRLSLQVAAGPTLVGGGNVLAAAFGYSPASRLELLLNVERIHLPFELKRFSDGFSATRGGTMTFAGGEVRLALLPPDRVSPFAMAGIGGGVSRPNVNAQFPDPVRNDLRVLYVGGGVRVPLRRRFTLLGDARGLLALEGNDGGLAILPVRTAITWRF